MLAFIMSRHSMKVRSAATVGAPSTSPTLAAMP